MDNYLVHNLSLRELVEDCRKYAYIEKGVQRRIIIIPNCSDAHSKLTKLLSNEGIMFSIDNSKTPPLLDEINEIYGECYVIDFRQIHLTD